MKKRAFIFLLVQICVAVATLSAQTTPTVLPYSCGFENGYDGWTADDGGTPRCRDLWHVGKSTSSDGDWSLYLTWKDAGAVLTDDDDAEYDTVPNIVVIKKEFLLPQGESCELSFDWRNMANNDNNSGLYLVMYTPGGSNEPQSQPGKSASPDWLSSACVMTLNDGSRSSRLYNSPDWTTASYRFRAPGAPRPIGFAFVWINGYKGKRADKHLRISASVDNIQLVSAQCPKPQNLVIDTTYCGVAELSWSNFADETEVDYKSNSSTQWRQYTVVNDAITKCRIEGLEEGVYDFRVRNICLSDDGTRMASAYTTLAAQLVFCPEDHCFNYVDFKNNSDIECYVGENNSGTSAWNPNQKVVDYGSNDKNSRHTLNFKHGVYDKRTGGNLSTIYKDDLLSIRLGNWNVSKEAERMDFKYTPDTVNPGILLLKYAIVFQAPNHGKDNPRFKLSILDDIGAAFDADCGVVDFVADINSPGWHETVDPNNTSSPLLYRDWQVLGVNLRPYANGKPITIRLETADCAAGAHYGYAYFSMDCRSGEIENVSCGSDPVNTIMAPEGFDYEWYKVSNDGTVYDEKNPPAGVPISTKQEFDAEASDEWVYYCKCMLKEDHNCFFFVHTVISPREPKADFTWEHKPHDCGNYVKLTNLSRVTTLDADGMVVDTDQKCDYSEWLIGDVRRAGQDIEYKFPDEGGTFQIGMAVELSGGACVDTMWQTVTIPSILTPPSVLDTAICHGKYLQFAGKSYFKSKDTTVNLTNIYDCDSVVTLHLTVYPKQEPVVIDTFVCFGEKYYVGDKPFTYSVNKQEVKLLSAGGCDSTVVLTLKVCNQITFTCSTTPESGTPRSGAIRIENLKGADPDDFLYTINGVEGGPLTDLSGGEYKIVVFNDYGCASDTVYATVDRDCLEVSLLTAENIVVCADDSLFRLEYQIDAGFLDGYELAFEDKALAEGFEPQKSSDVSGAKVLDVNIPADVLPNSYRATLKFIDVICEPVVYTLSVDVYYPSSIIHQKWNDVLAVLNEQHNNPDGDGYDFSAYQWYFDGNAIPGANGSYYYTRDAELDASGDYSVLLTRANDGVRMPTCPISIERRTDVSQWPTLSGQMKSGGVVSMSGVGRPLTVRLTAASGIVVLEERISESGGEIQLPPFPGVYIVSIIDDTACKVYKISLF